jgi:lipoyl(octanoyl) transferase
VPYAEALALQRSLVEERRPDGSATRCCSLEHPHVLTLGVRGDGGRSHMLATRRRCAARGIEVHETGRGGDITYHGPGSSSATRSSISSRIAATCTATCAISKRC